MTRQEIEARFRVWQQTLHLERWEITLQWEAAIEEAAAEVTWDGLYDNATIKLSQCLLEKSTSYVEKTIIHELLHLHDRSRSEMLAEIEGSLAPDTFRLFGRVVYLLTEEMVDRLATILYEQDQLARMASSRTS
jgi:hypothetical protein